MSGGGRGGGGGGGRGTRFSSRSPDRSVGRGQPRRTGLLGESPDVGMPGMMDRPQQQQQPPSRWGPDNVGAPAMGGDGGVAVPMQMQGGAMPMAMGPQAMGPQVMVGPQGMPVAPFGMGGPGPMGPAGPMG
jgi:hypothetical protein